MKYVFEDIETGNLEEFWSNLDMNELHEYSKAKQKNVYQVTWSIDPTYTHRP
jgi:hypothetical protein